jgi:alpha-glucosidase (family GH31 glycosyl hydrolase)
MIRHRPFGSGHPYATTADQRVPAVPEVDRPVTLGVTGTRAVTAVQCELVSGSTAGQQVSVLQLDRQGHDPAAALQAVGGAGHLADAQARAGAASGTTWAVTIPAVRAGHRYRYRFIATASDGRTRRTRWHEFVPVRWSAEPPAGAVLDIEPDRLVPGSVQWRRSAGPEPGAADRVRFALHLAPGVRVVGFGERYDALDQRGRTLDSVVFEQYKSQGRWGRTYLPMPFAHVVGGDGWGFHVRTSRRCWFDVGRTDTDAMWVEAELGADQRVSMATYSGPPDRVLAEFGDEVGRAEELPDWVFRLWASGNEWNTQDLVMNRMDEHRALDIPIGTVVIEAWSDEQTFTAFRDARYQPTRDGGPHTAADFDHPPDGAWPDPKGMVDELHRRGIRVVLWQIPLQKMQPAPTGQARADADALVRHGFAVREADGRPYRNRGWWFPKALMPDLTDPAARQWWTGKRRYLVREYGIDGFKTDGGEHAWGHDLRYAGDRRGDEMNNLFGVHYARAFGDLLRSEGKAPVTFSRAGYTGTQAHGIVWAGDEDSTWDAFRWSITAGLTAAACGIVYWGWDIAGFSGPGPGAELYLRATAASAFMPIMQYHSEFNHHRRPLRDRTPWHVAELTGDDRVVPVFRTFAQLRDRLVPYLAEQARRSIERSVPLMRALMFDWPRDERIWDFPLQYLLGDDLLVAPVTREDVQTWAVYLPAGDWVDVWTGRAVTQSAVPGDDRGAAPDGAGRVVTRSVPIDVIPVYCRAAAWDALAPIFRHA